jgi:NitT/TauT family transport system substrate-binding protein
MSMRRTPAAVLALAALALTAACGSSSPSRPAGGSGSGQPDKVNVGTIAIVDVAPIYLGKQRGFFRQRNIDLTLTPAQGGAVIVPAVVSGQFQFGISNVTSLLLAASNGLPVKIVCNGDASSGTAGKDFDGLMVRGDSPIKGPAELAGKRVAVNTLKNIADTTVRAVVRKAGGDPKAVRFVELGFPDMLPALQAGRVDAMFVVEPFVSLALAAGARTISSAYAEVAPNLTVGVYFTSKQQISSHPDLVKRFTEAMKESLAYADSHSEEVRAILSSYTQIKSDVAASLTLPRFPPEINRDSVKVLSDLAEQDGLLTKAPDLNDLLP